MGNTRIGPGADTLVDMAADESSYDLVILGGGSAGETAAARVAQAGKRVALIESRLVGGECPYWGCVPSKALLIAAARRSAALRAHDLGAVSGPVKLDDPRLAWPAALAMRDLRAEHLDDTDAAARLRNDGVEIVRDTGRVLGPGRVAAGERELRYRNLLISTGAEAALPPIDGLAEAEPWTSEDALTSTELPDRLVILGGGAIGCELSQVYATFGSDVVVVEALDRVLVGEEPAVSAAAADVLRRSGVRISTGTAVERVSREGDQTLVHLADGQVLAADRLLVATGRRPRVRDLGLETLGIDTDAGRLEIGDDARVVGQSNVYAAGDVIGRLQFTHTANYAGRVVAANVLGGDARLDFSAIPRGVYIDPPVAGVGMSMQQAKTADRSVVSATVQVGDTARAWLEAEGGVLVLVADAHDGVLVGASALGPRADEWIAQVTLAIRARIPLRTLVDTVQPFPAVSEILFPAYEQLLAKVS